MNRTEIMEMHDIPLYQLFETTFLGGVKVGTVHSHGAIHWLYVLPVLRGWDANKQDLVTVELMKSVGERIGTRESHRVLIYADPIDYVRAMLIVEASGGEG